MPVFKEFLCANCYCMTTGVKTKLSKLLFCSNKCQWDFEWKCRKEAITKAGEYASVKGARRYLIDIRGHICEICKLTTWQEKPIPLVCDHIDGNSDNWKLINLRMICSNCDAQTDTYKNKNAGKGRHFRRQRYKEGKSF